MRNIKKLASDGISNELPIKIKSTEMNTKRLTINNLAYRLQWTNNRSDTGPIQTNL